MTSVTKHNSSNAYTGVLFNDIWTPSNTEPNYLIPVQFSGVKYPIYSMYIKKPTRGIFAGNTLWNSLGTSLSAEEFWNYYATALSSGFIKATLNKSNKNVQLIIEYTSAYTLNTEVTPLYSFKTTITNNQSTSEPFELLIPVLPESFSSSNEWELIPVNVQVGLYQSPTIIGNNVFNGSAGSSYSFNMTFFVTPQPSTTSEQSNIIPVLGVVNTCKTCTTPTASQTKFYQNQFGVVNVTLLTTRSSQSVVSQIPVVIGTAEGYFS